MTDRYTLDAVTSNRGEGLSRVVVKVGPTGDEQESSFANATLQSDTSGVVEFSIAMHVKVDASKLETPIGDEFDAVDRVAHHIHNLLLYLASCSDGTVEFEAEVGPEGGR